MAQNYKYHTMIRTKTYTALLKKQTHDNLDTFLLQQKFLYNKALNERINYHKETGKSLSNIDQRNAYTRFRQENPEYQIFDSFAQRTIYDRLHKSFQNFFRRIKSGDKPGFPRYKSHIRSFETSQFSIKEKKRYNSITIKGIGTIRFKGSIPDDVKLLRIVSTALRTKVQLVHEIPDNTIEDTRPEIGIDRGINKLIALSNGTYIEGRKLDRTQLKRKQKKLSKAVKGSNNRRKKRNALAKEWQRTTEQEKNFLHRITSDLIKNTSSKFYLEDLQINNMTKNKHLSRSILEQYWGYFEQLLAYKAESAGGWVSKIDPKYTSKTCSSCGAVNKFMTTEPIFKCVECGHEQDRDLNAANVILQRGLNKSSQSGGKRHSNTMLPETCGVYTNYNLPLALDSSDVKRVEHVERYSA